MRVIGIDFGAKRIGIALGGDVLATPYEVVIRAGDRQADHRRILQIADEVEADRIVVGLPLSLDGSLGPAARAVLEEVEELRARTDRPVDTYDERFTTVTAEQSLHEMNVKGPARRQVVDKIAATVMLQAWLDRQATQGS